MEAFKFIPYIILMIGIGGIIAGATAIVLAQFQASTTDASAIAAIKNATSGVGTVSKQLPTMAIIGVMVIIISLIVSVVAYFRFFR